MRVLPPWVSHFPHLKSDSNNTVHLTRANGRSDLLGQEGTDYRAVEARPVTF